LNIGTKVRKIKLTSFVCQHDDFIFYKRVYLSQHSKNPFIIEDNRQKKAWEIAGTQIVHINNSSKRSIKIRINRDILSKLKS